MRERLVFLLAFFFELTLGQGQGQRIDLQQQLSAGMQGDPRLVLQERQQQQGGGGGEGEGDGGGGKKIRLGLMEMDDDNWPVGYGGSTGGGKGFKQGEYDAYGMKGGPAGAVVANAPDMNQPLPSGAIGPGSFRLAHAETMSNRVRRAIERLFLHFKISFLVLFHMMTGAEKMVDEIAAFTIIAEKYHAVTIQWLHKFVYQINNG